MHDFERFDILAPTEEFLNDAQRYLERATCRHETLPSGEPFSDVLRKALTAKVPKLVATAADKHILLFEDGGTAIGFAKTGKGIDENIEALPELAKVDAVWSIHTM